MADVNITGTLLISGSLFMTGGANTFFELPRHTNDEIILMLSGWGIAEEGRCWFNNTSFQAEMWDGSSRNILG